MEQSIKDQIYIEAFNKLKNASSVADYQEIIRLLEQCEGMMDSEDLILQCRNEIENIQREETYQLAISLSKKRDSSALDQSMKLLSSLGDYKDSRILLGKVRQRRDRSGIENTVSDYRCSQCGHFNREHTAFCTKCGSPLNASSSDAGPAGKKLPIILIIGILLLVVAGLIVGILLHHSSSTKDRTAEIAPQDLGSFVIEHFREASDLYCYVFLEQSELDREDTFTDMTRYGMHPYYHVPQANTKAEFIEYCRQFYSADTVDSIISENDYIERDGKLYMSTTLGLGGPMITEAELSAEKISDEEYLIRIREKGDPFGGPDTIVERYLTLENGYWVWDRTLFYPRDIEVTYTD